MLYYENLRMTGIFADLTISNVIIDSGYNDHAYIVVEGIFPSESKEQYLFGDFQKEILTLISEDENNQKNIFSGVILNTKVRHVGEVYTIQIQAASQTYLLDVVKESKSYQDISVSYGDVIRAELNQRDALHINCDADKEKPIDAFLLKYEESCWDFIKRMASHHHAGLIPDMAYPKPAFWIGMPKGRPVHQLELLPDKRTQQPHDALPMKSTLQYVLSGRTEYFALGNIVEVQGREYRIYTVHGYLDKQDGVMRFDYHLTTEQECFQPLLENKNIQGLCLSGRVIDRKKDFAKVHLDTIDGSQEVAEASWFRVAAFYAAGNDRGWCAMPEIGDTLDLYFPTSNEDDCFLREAICTSFPPLANRVNNQAKMAVNPYVPQMGADKTPSSIPETKYIDVPNGQSVLLNEDVIHFSSEGGSATISLTSGQKDLTGTTLGLKIKTEGDICLSGNKVKFGSDETDSLTLASGKSIIMICEDTSITMDGDTGNTDLYAIEVAW